MRVDEAMDYLIQEEEERLIDMDTVARSALDRVESAGIIFLDEIDKIAGRESGSSPDVSREECSEIFCPLSKEPPLTPGMEWFARITYSL